MAPPLILFCSLSPSVTRNGKFCLPIQYSSRCLPLLEIGWPPSGKDRKSLDVSFRPVGRSHTRCWGDNEPSDKRERGREADNKSFLLAPPNSFPPLLSITFSEKLQGHCSVRDVLMNWSPTSIYVMHNEMHFWRNCGIPPCIFPSQL